MPSCRIAATSCDPLVDATVLWGRIQSLIVLTLISLPSAVPAAGDTAAGARGGPGGPPMARLGFPVGGPGGLQFQVHIGGPPPGVAEDEDLMEVPSPREPPTRRRHREAPSPREEPPARRRRSS